MNTPNNSGLPVRILTVNTLMFAVAFGAWLIFGPTARAIAADLHLTPSQATLLKTLPILAGSVGRIPAGLVSDRFGPRLTFSGLLLLSAAAIFAASVSQSWPVLAFAAFSIGAAGTTFVVGVHSVSSWSSKERQGTALGIFGAGNIGSVLAVLGAPWLLGLLPWRQAFQCVAMGMVVAAALYYAGAPDRPRTSPAKHIRQLIQPLSAPLTWVFGLYYMASFGAFVAMTLLISDLYIDGYNLPMGQAGLFATSFTLTGSLARIPGGFLSDRFGAHTVLAGSLIAVLVSVLLLTSTPPLWASVGMMAVAGGAMGFGMAATFKFIPEAFPDTVGVVGGAVGMVGGLAGFILPIVSSAFPDVSMKLLPIAVLAGIALVAQRLQVRGLHVVPSSPRKEPSTT